MPRTGAKVDAIEGLAMATSKDPRGGGSLGHSSGSASVWLRDVDKPLAFSGLRLPSWKISSSSLRAGPCSHLPAARGVIFPRDFP